MQSYNLNTFDVYAKLAYKDSLNRYFPAKYSENDFVKILNHIKMEDIKTFLKSSAFKLKQADKEQLLLDYFKNEHSYHYKKMICIKISLIMNIVI